MEDSRLRGFCFEKSHMDNLDKLGSHTIAFKQDHKLHFFFAKNPSFDYSTLHTFDSTFE